MAALTFIFALGFPAPMAFAQDEDLDLEAEDTGGNFDDLEGELNSETPAPAAPPAEAAPAPAPAPEAAPPVAEEPPPPTIEEDQQQAEEPAVPPTVEPEASEPAPEVAEPEAPAEEAPTEETAETPAETPPAAEQEAEVFRSEADTPDDEFEARMARIYKQFYGTRTSDAEWVQIVGPKASERYVVQGGDTLWGISQTFFGNGFFWPKLWQLNADYTNPHLLEVSDSIQFSPGTVAVEPTVNLTQKASKYYEPDPPRAAVTPEQAKAYMANVQMPAPYPYRPVVKTIPGSLPTVDTVSKGYDDSGFSLESVRRFVISDITHLGFSVSEGPPTSDGEIIEAETGGNLINLYQEGVAKLSGAKEGDHFYAFRVNDKIKNEYGSAYPIEYQGEIEVLESVGNGRFRILCVDAITQMVVGSLLRKGTMPKVSFAKTGTPGNVSAKVFGGHYDSDRKSLAAGNLVYIAGGRDKGIEVNQLLTVLKDFKLRNPETVLREPEEPIGLIKIINVSNSVSTGYILESREDLRQGDVTGPGDVY